MYKLLLSNYCKALLATLKLMIELLTINVSNLADLWVRES